MRVMNGIRCLCLLPSQICNYNVNHFTKATKTRRLKTEADCVSESIHRSKQSVDREWFRVIQSIQSIQRIQNMRMFRISLYNKYNHYHNHHRNHYNRNHIIIIIFYGTQYMRVTNVLGNIALLGLAPFSVSPSRQPAKSNFFCSPFALFTSNPLVSDKNHNNHNHNHIPQNLRHSILFEKE